MRKYIYIIITLLLVSGAYGYADSLVYVFDWGNVTINETGIHGVTVTSSSINDTNETVWKHAAANNNCTGQVVVGIYLNGTWICEADDSGAGAADGVGYNSSTINTSSFTDIAGVLNINTPWWFSNFVRAGPVTNAQWCRYNSGTGNITCDVAPVSDSTCDSSTCDVTNTGTLDGYEGADLLNGNCSADLACDALLYESELNSIAELNTQIADATVLISGGTLTNTKWCVYDGTGVDCNVEPVTDTTIGNCSATDACPNVVYEGELTTGLESQDTCSEITDCVVGAITNESMNKTVYYGDIVACADTQILKMSGADWTCAADVSGGGGGSSLFLVNGLWIVPNSTAGGTQYLSIYNGNFTTINVTNLFVSGTTYSDVTGDLTGNADTATNLAADPADCGANEFANAIGTSGALSCSAIGDADIPNDITIDLASSATALAANGANCAAGSYPLGVDDSGAVEDCTDATTEINSAIGTHAATKHGNTTTEIQGVAVGGDCSGTVGSIAVTDDSHNHVYSNIDAFTEANLYTILSDVSQFWENGDSVTGCVGANEAYGAGWNSDTACPEKDDVYDAFGATPGGELGGTWASPTVDDTALDDQYVDVDGDTMTGNLNMSGNGINTASCYNLTNGFFICEK